MIRFKFVVVVLCFWNVFGYSQQIVAAKNQSILEILEMFKNQHQFNFSYDVEAIKNIKLTIGQSSISIDSLVDILKEQTPFILQKVADRSYILVKNDQTIEICGFVIDSITTVELTQATIIKDINAIKSTDEQGYFRLRLSPRDSISISYLGYDTKTIKVSNFSASRCDTIQLKPEVQNLSQIIINEYLTTGVQKNKDASINVSTKKLRILPGLVEPDVLQSLQLVPGISSPTEDPAGLYIRGGTPDQNLVLWDGIKMYHNGHFFNQISTFNPYIVKNVKVYRGGTSARYGDRISGVIIIESDDDLTEALKIGGGVNFTHADLFIKAPVSEKVGVMGAFRRSTTDIYQNIAFNNLTRKVFQNTRGDISDDNLVDTMEEESREDNFSFSDINFKVVWNPNAKNTVKLSTIFAQNRLDNDTPPQEINSPNSFSTNDFYKIKNVGASLNWKKKYSNNSIQKTSFYFSSYDTRYKIERKGIDINQNFNYTQNNDVKDIGIAYSLDIPIAKKQSLALGYQFAYNETKYDFAEVFTGDFEAVFDNITNGYSNNHTVYSEYMYKGVKTYANFGLRGSYISSTDQFFVEPRMFSSIEIFKNFRITTSAELKNQQLNSFNDFGSISPSIGGLPVADNKWLLSGNILYEGDSYFIPVIKSRQFTFGSLYTYKGWNFDLEGYYKKLTDITSINDLILDVVPSEDNTGLSIGKEERIGFDFLLKKRIRNYRFWIGYSLSKTLVTFPKLQQKSFSGNFDQRHVLNISQTLKVNDFEFALGWNYATGSPYTKLIPDENGALGNTIDPEGINTSRFKAYHRLDASVVYRFNFKTKHPWGGMFGFSLRNIYNRKNTLDQGFTFKTGENDIILETFERKSLRLTPDVVIRFNF
ncbi:TonB-dependent receptor [Flavivirga amylovorans]|uniref:TonB-dependent receptor n=1 Tax=Flavivirga amylovorans TaxID=870486 RepID=A0ABT8X1I6_9FLAO|nr:TonB-dependent receptor plug domain-containing protein [Flavivirga amylovorans]MDO5987808.1 TonB-dependent receptor [Flavivirga amylovorans]